MSGNSRVFAASLVFLVTASFLAVRVEAEWSALGAKPATDPLYQLIGSAKEAVGDTMLLKAESYFHGGSEREFGEENEEERERQGHIHEAHELEAHDPADWPALINERVKSHEHYHLRDNEQKEILPFLFLGTQLDPYHVEAQLSTAFWLERQLNKRAEAIEVLMTARRYNPDSWEIAYELGNLYFRAKQYERAVVFYEEAEKKLGPAVAESMQAAHLQFYLAESWSQIGDAAKARQHYEAFLKLLPPGQAIPLRQQVTQKLESLV